MGGKGVALFQLVSGDGFLEEVELLPQGKAWQGYVRQIIHFFIAVYLIGL